MSGYDKETEDFGDWLRCANLATEKNLSKPARKCIYNAENRTKWMRVSLEFRYCKTFNTVHTDASLTVSHK